MSDSSLHLRLLGPLEITLAGETLPLPSSKKTRALMGYLAANEKAFQREQLCRLLWEGPDDPRASLRWSLSKIKPLLDAGGETRLIADRNTVCFAVGKAEVDYARVRMISGDDVGSMTRDQLEKLDERFRGDFLEGLDLPECLTFHQWWIAERENARAKHKLILDSLVSQLQELPDAALPYARRRVMLDPTAEAAHLGVLRLLDKLGRRSEALEQYESCRQILSEELGIAPSAEMEKARRELGRKVGLPVEPEHRSSAASGPLVGRDQDIAAVASWISRAESGSRNEVLFISGEAGIGKSRLLEEITQIVRLKGGMVLGGRAFEAEMIRPYGAWIDLLRSIDPGTISADLQRELAPLLPELSAKSKGGDRNRLFDAVRQLLLKQKMPLLVHLDDLQWFDDASAALLHYVARASDDHPLLIATAARDGELSDNKAASRVVRGLESEGRLRALPLSSLGLEDIRLLMKEIDPEGDAERIFAEGGGNPLFTMEISRALRQSDIPLSDSLEGIIAQKFRSLSSDAKDLLTWAAALGRDFDPETLINATAMTSNNALRAIDELERRGIFRTVMISPHTYGYDFAHDLVRQAAYRQLSEPRRRLVHLQIARTLLRANEASSLLASEIGHHAALGGDSPAAARAYLDAAERGLRMFANMEAVELAQRGLVHVRRLPPEKRIPLEAALLSVHVHSGVNPDFPLESEIRRLAAEAEAIGFTSELATCHHLEAILRQRAGDFAGAQVLTELAASVSRAADRHTTALHLAHTGRCLAQLRRDLPRAESLLQEAQRLAETMGVSIAEIPLGRGLIHQQRGSYDEAVLAFEEALPLIRQEQDRFREVICLAQLCMIELERAAPERALSRASVLLPVASKLTGSERTLAVAMHQTARLMLGEDDAYELLLESIEELRRIDDHPDLAYVLNLLGELELNDGRHTAAEEHAREALSCAELVALRSEAAIAHSILAMAASRKGEMNRARAFLAFLLTGSEDEELTARAKTLSTAAREAINDSN